VIVLALAWAYVRYGSLPEVQWLMYGVKPVIIAVVVRALWGLGRTATKGPITGLVGAAVMDAIAVGQFTPRPVFTTAAFIGYLIAGLPGAILATFGILFPSFVLVAASNPLIPRLRRSAWAGGFLDGVNVASLGLMAVVTWQLARAALVDAVTAGLGLGGAGVGLAVKLLS
jgi:chromate transport protein ChrA